jgi:hypothetical protein
MTTEEMERAIEFLLQQQAKFSVDIEKTRATVDHVAAMIVDLVEVVRHHDERADDSDKQIKELRESVKQTTDNLNALIRVVDGHVSNHP